MKIAVTGLGAVTSVGHSVGTFWQSLVLGWSGVDHITSFDVTNFETRIGAEVKEFAAPISIDSRRSRRLDRYALFALSAAIEAWDDSGLNIAELDPHEIGVIIGSSHGGEWTVFEESRKLFYDQPARVSPLLIPKYLNNMANAHAAIALGIKGPSFSISSACATGANAIGEAAELIRRGDAEVMVCGGADASISPVTLAGDQALGALSKRNDSPKTASRPFDIDRDGFVLGEGAGVLVLERLDRARERRANIYAEICGYSASSDAFHETRPIPNGEGVARAMKKAMGKARATPRDVGAVFAHATSTFAGDKAEAAAIQLALGSDAHTIPVTAIKSMIGHTLGASGAIQAIAAVLALRNNVVPPTVNLLTPDPDCDLDFVQEKARLVDLNTVLSNSMGFGGHNVSLLFCEVDE